MKHLNSEERNTFEQMKRQGHNQKTIAMHLGRSESTLSREKSRNALVDGSYSALFAHRSAKQRTRGKPHYRAINEQNTPLLQAGLEEKLSPEQIVGRAKQQQSEIGMPCIATIYRHIHHDRKQGGKLHRNLRQHGHRRKKYRHGKGKRPTIRNRKDISERPAEVAKRDRLGDLECDLIMGAGQSGVLLTVNCRASGKVWIKKLGNKEASGVKKGLINILGSLKEKLHTITSDNGKEFSLHEKVSAALDCAYYFARPYHSWERGSNENTNGLIRQYFPKKMEFWRITGKQVKEVEEALNNRPRKRYNFLTPNEKHQQLLQNN